MCLNTIAIQYSNVITVILIYRRKIGPSTDSFRDAYNTNKHKYKLYRVCACVRVQLKEKKKTEKMDKEKTRRKKDFLAVLLTPPLFLKIEGTKVKTKPRGLADFFPCLWRLAKPQKLLESRFNSMFLKTFWSLPTCSLVLRFILSFTGYGKYRPNRLYLVPTKTFVPETFFTRYYYQFFIELYTVFFLKNNEFQKYCQQLYT